MLNTPIVSVIIPCYNHGYLLKEALESLKECDQSIFEVIIVNDGSTDALTNEYLEKLRVEGNYNVIIQKNAGLAKARNRAIEAAEGKYILPLDADNTILPAFFSDGVKIMESNDGIDVLYGNANYIGDKIGILKPGKFNLQRLMLGNYIDACALIRKKSLVEVKMYDTNMPVMGYEDWDLWLRMAFEGYKFEYINEPLFNYRFTSQSMMRNLKNDIEKRNIIEQYFLDKYPSKLDFGFIENYFTYHLKKRPFFILYRLLIKKYFPSYYNRLILQHKLYKGHIYD